MNDTDYPKKPQAEGKKEPPQEETFAMDFGSEAEEPAQDAAPVSADEAHKPGEAPSHGAPTGEEETDSDEAFTYDLSYMADLEEELLKSDDGHSGLEDEQRPQDDALDFSSLGGEEEDKALGEEAASTGGEAEAPAQAAVQMGEEEAPLPMDPLALDEAETDMGEAGLGEGAEAAATAASSPQPEPKQEETAFAAAAEPQRQGASSRMLALAAAVAVLVGGGLYLAMRGDEPRTAPPATLERQAVTATVPPVKATQAEAPAAAMQEPVVEAMPEAGTQEEKIARIEPMPTAPEASTQEETTAPMQEAGKAPVELAAVTPPMPRQRTSGRYTLQGGAFIFRSNLARLQKKLADMGLATKVVEGKKTVPMIRLRVGVYPQDVAAAKLKEVAAASAAGAFPLPKNGGTAVYAGSYFYASGAERAAKALAAKGIAVEKEAAEVTVPMYILHIGSFASRQEAAAKQAELRTAGIAAKLIEAAAP